MSTTISHVYDRHSHARSAVQALESAGVPSGDISIVAAQRTVESQSDDMEHDSTAAAAGVGATLGVGTGLLAALGVVAIPGLGPVVAAGWLVAVAAGAVTGATAGAIVGGLVDVLRQTGEPEEKAHVYAEVVRRGGTLVTARVSDAKLDEARAILERFDPVDAAARDREYRAAGWNGFDSNAGPHRLTQAEMDRIRWESRSSNL